MRRGGRRSDALLKSVRRKNITPYESLFWEHSTPGSMRSLLMAGLECFAEQGFHGTTTRDISKGANMSAAAMYLHFKSKESLLFHIAVVMSRAGHHALEEASLVPGTPKERLRRMAKTHAEFHAKMSMAARVTNYEIRSLGPKRRRVVLDLVDGSRELFRHCLRDGMATGEFRIADLSIATTAIISLTIVICQWFQPNGKLTPEEVGEQYAHMVMGMVTSGQLQPQLVEKQTGARPRPEPVRGRLTA
jgi:AcrR family transcriptional regulator